MIRRPLSLLLFCFLTLQAQKIDKSFRTGYESIKAADLKAHLMVLTSDSLEGRETSFPGQRKAANYIAEHFKKLKLEAVGDDGTYFQHFDVELTHVSPETRIATEIQGIKKAYMLGADFIVREAKDTTVTGPVVFVGFNDAELDSAAQSKVKGRIVFVFLGKRNLASDTSKATILRRLYAFRRDAGALATLIIPDLEGPASFENARQMNASFGWEKGTMQIKDNATQQTKPGSIRFLVSPELAEEALKPSGISLKQLRDQALLDQPVMPIFIDSAVVTIESKVIRETKQTENVVGLLQGSDPDLKTQVVAFTAHYDHIGKSSTGVIYPGADDDGSGTATVMELAEAFVKNPTKSKRSLLFMTVVGEEKGLLGSKYYTSNPIIPLDQTMADLNIDMIGRIDTIHEATRDTNFTYVIGSDKISVDLDSILQSANNESVRLNLDYKYNSDQDPEQYYRRSDHYNFAKNGVPVVFFFDGIHADYHQPTDTIDKILFNRMANIGHLIYVLGWKLANLDRSLVKNSTQP